MILGSLSAIVSILAILYGSSQYYYSTLTVEPIFTSPTGKIVQFDEGATHYVLNGPEKGELVVLIHGIAGNLLMLQDLANYLNQQGFRTLNYDLYGRGHSSVTKKVTHDEKLYLRQALKLLKTIGNEKKPFHIVGLSLGGAIGSVLAAEVGDQVKTATFVAPAGHGTQIPFLGKVLSTPILGDFLYTVLGPFINNKRVSNYFEKPENNLKQLEFLSNMTMFHWAKPGFVEAFSGTVRDFPLGDITDYLKKVGDQKYPVLYIWGKEDDTCPYFGTSIAKTLIPRSQFITFEKGRHLSLLEYAQQLNPQIVNFLKTGKK